MKSTLLCILCLFSVASLGHQTSIQWCTKRDSEQTLTGLNKLLQMPTLGMSAELQAKTMQMVKCSIKNGVDHNGTLVVIDYSLPSNEKRLWVIDYDKATLLYHTYVSHGLRTGHKQPEFFSNRNNSKATSLGVFKTAEAYYGRYGLALKLHGLESKFNHNAYNRFIVMHGGWYVSDDFVNKYGRTGRSWGCPAIPRSLTKSIIHSIKGGALFVAYYPGERWMAQSKYLNCQEYCPIPDNLALKTIDSPPLEGRGTIVFAETRPNGRMDTDEPIIVMSANDYQKVFHNEVPLKRMLRRQIKQSEYIALSHKEFQEVVSQHPEWLSKNSDNQAQVLFVVPEVKKLRGYWATEFKVVGFGEIESVSQRVTDSDNDDDFEYTVSFKSRKPLVLKTSDRFIRWLGL